MRLSAGTSGSTLVILLFHLSRKVHGQFGCSSACLQNGGQCVQDYNSLTYSCDCSGTGGSGPDCSNGQSSPPATTSTTTSPPASTSGTTTCPVTCYNGNCTQQENSNSYYCKCNPGFAQPSCQYPLSPPAPPPNASSSTRGTHTCPVPCEHGACDQQYNSEAYVCTCNPGYYGVACNMSSTPPPAPGSSQAASPSGTYTCPVTCIHGQCLHGSGADNYYCECETGYSGASCNASLASEAPSPAVHCDWCTHGTCSYIPNSRDEYFCDCDPGYTDWDCSKLTAATSSSDGISDENGGRTLRGWKIFVIVLICMAGVILLASVAYILYRRRGKKTFVKFQDNEFGGQEPQEIEIRRTSQK